MGPFVIIFKCTGNIFAGFDDQDMERPSFAEPAVHASVPLLLSKPGVSPVIQVSINVPTLTGEGSVHTGCCVQTHGTQSENMLTLNKPSPCSLLQNCE